MASGQERSRRRSPNREGAVSEEDFVVKSDSMAHIRENGRVPLPRNFTRVHEAASSQEAHDKS